MRFSHLLMLSTMTVVEGVLEFKLGDAGQSCNDVCSVGAGACQIADGWSTVTLDTLKGLGLDCNDMPPNGGVWANEVEPGYNVSSGDCMGYLDVGAANGHANQVGCGDTADEIKRVCSCLFPDPGFSVQTYPAPWFTGESGSPVQLVGIVLKSMPPSTVTIPVVSSNTDEGIPSLSMLIFEPTNWNQPQTFAINGQNDFVVDGNKTYTVTIGPAVANASNPYNGMTIPISPMSITNIDDDVPGVTVTPTSGLRTDESGTTVTFTMVLDTLPSADVTIAVSSNNTAEGVVSPTSITFTPSNWNVSQTVTLTGVPDDFVDDGDQIYKVITSSAISTDPLYSSLEVDDVIATNVNNDIANVIIKPECALVVVENGARPYPDIDPTTFTVKITSRPIAPVSFTLSSSDTTEGVPEPTMIHWEPSDWKTVHTLTLVPVDDNEPDCDITYDILLSNGDSTDPKYGGLWQNSIKAITQDDDGYCVRVFPICITTFEGAINPDNAGQQDIRISLSKQPADGAVITVPVISSDTTEGIPASPEVVFTSANWSTVVDLTINGINDYYEDGTIDYTVTVGAAQATNDINYPNKKALLVAARNIDDDVHGVKFNPGSVAITEDVNQTPVTTFDVVLTSMPYYPVTINIQTQNITRAIDETFPSRVKPSPESLSLHFEPSVWNISQTITVTSLDNWIDDGDKEYMMVGIDSSMDTMYNTGQMVAYTAVQLKDNDTAGVVVQIDGTNLPVSFETYEEFKNVTTLEIFLTSQPLGPVNVSFTGTDNRRREDIFWREVTIDPEYIIISPEKWNVSQFVTLTCNDDKIVDGNVDLMMVAASSSSDPLYNTYRTETWFKTIDNDEPGISYTLKGPGYTNETGTTTTLEFQMLTEPLCRWEMPDAVVWVQVISTNPLEGVPERSMYYISSENWTTPTTITVVGVDDWVADGDQPYNITATIVRPCNFNGVYTGLQASQELINGDDDVPGLFLNSSQTMTSENGTSLDLTLVLQSQPLAEVLVTVASNDTTEGTVVMNMLRFTPEDWNVSQFITVTGVDDTIVDGTIAYEVSVTASSPDTQYNGLTASTTLYNADNDIPGFVIGSAQVVTSEGGRTDTFTIALSTKPMADVVISSISTNDSSEATVGAVSLTFTPDNWNVPQSVVVTGVDDDVQDGDQPFLVLIGAPTTTDANYKAVTATVPGVNIDNDTPGIAIYPTTQLSTSESGDSSVFTVVLRTQPKADVSFTVAVNDKTEGSLNTSRLLFTTSTWSVPQTVMVTGVDDQLFDGDIQYNVVFGNVVSSDPGYASLPAVSPVVVVNKDNETSPCAAYTGTCVMKAGRCEMCCPSTCTQCKESACDPSDPCCMIDVSNQCSDTVHAPCSIVKPCTQFGLVCNDTACTVCCEASCLDKCAPYDGFCSSVACTTCRPNSCGLVDCTDAANAASSCCKPVDPSVGECSLAVPAPCKMKSPCSPYGAGICKDGACNVCCKSTCSQCGGSMCTANPMDTDCCDTAIAKGKTYCSDEGATSPCIRNDKCKEWGGICQDEACSVCCDSSCGVCSEAGGAKECTPSEIFKNGTVCGPGVQAPCIRGTPCSEYGGICKDEACNVCCDNKCGSCGSSDACSASPADASCCDTEIAKTKVYCSKDVPAPCIRNNLCQPYGGICQDEKCTVCCDAQCGECGSLTCSTNPSAKCCTAPIIDSGVMCSETSPAPCIREHPSSVCDAVGGICKDKDCNVCCKGSCSECGGSMCTANPMDTDCCDTAIAKNLGYCKAVGNLTAPCIRNPMCKEHGGICMNVSCEICCKPECGECLAAPCSGPCCETTIVASNKKCDSSTSAPCVRSTPSQYCEGYGGMCADAECKECCDGSCGMCSDTGNSCDGGSNDQCCPGKIREQKQECSVSGKAPCVRVSKCTEYGGICDDLVNCKVCCTPGCGGTCGKADTCGTVLSEEFCCSANITAAAATCGVDGAVAPCLLPSSGSDSNLLLIILIIIGVLLCCCCLLAALWLMKRRSHPNTGDLDDEKNQNWFTMEEKRSDMQTLLTAKADDDEQAAAATTSDKPKTPEKTPEEKSVTPSPARATKKRGMTRTSAPKEDASGSGAFDI